MYQIIMTKQAIKDREKLKQAGLLKQAKTLVFLLETDPFVYPPFYEKLCGDMSGLYSRRINRQHRLVYEVLETQKIVRIYKMWTHYE